MPERNKTTQDSANPSASTARVLQMDQAYRLERQRTVRSTCYQEKLASLAHDGQHRVAIMEGLLFEESRRAASCTLGDLHLPDSRFDCAEGSIWYHFSAGQKLFVLSYFELAGRGGNRAGGSGGGHLYITGSVSRVPCGWGEGIAAKLGRLLAAERSSTIDWAAWLNVETQKPLVSVWLDDHDECVDPATRNGQLLIDIAASCHILRSPDQRAALPSWSLLRHAVRVSEELENPYARSIFAGEALCRLGLEIGSGRARALRWGPFAKRGQSERFRCTSSELFAESAAILGAVRDGQVKPSFRCDVRHYLTASLMDDDMLADVRRLRLIRNEMTFRLAITVGWHAARTETADEAREALHRYAMLSDFVRLSADYFGVADEPLTGMDVIEDLAECEHRDREVVRAAVYDLDDFGSSTAMIIDQLTPTTEQSVDDPSTKHDRLCWLVSRILVVNECGAA